MTARKPTTQSKAASKLPSSKPATSTTDTQDTEPTPVAEPVVETSLRGATSAIVAVDESSFVPTPTEPVVETPPVKTALSAKTPTPKQVQLNTPLKRTTPPDPSNLLNIVKDGLSTYVDGMQPNRILTEQQGARFQLGLWNTIKTVLCIEGPLFYAAMDLLLECIDQNSDTVFGGRYVYRHMDSVPISNDDRRALERMLNLLTLTAKRSTRGASLKLVDLGGTAESLRNGPQGQRLISYYSE